MPTGDHDEFGRALRILRHREDLGFAGFDTVDAKTRLRRYPDFLIIGAQKAGTTWLHNNLNYHPNIWLAPAKELNYFNQVSAPSSDQWEGAGRASQVAAAREFLLSASSLSQRQQLKLAALDVIEEGEVSDDWYGRIFAHAPSQDLCGESSPDYCVLPRGGIAHVASLNPKIKAILLVRDPIDRLWSHVRMAAQNGYGEANLEFLKNDYVWRVYQGRSNYPEMLRRWRSMLGSEQVIVLNYDLIAAAPALLLKAACEGLGLMFDARFFPNATSTIGPGKRAEMPEDIYEMAKGRMRYIYDALWKVMPAECDAWVARHYYHGSSAALAAAKTVVETQSQAEPEPELASADIETDGTTAFGPGHS